MRIARYSGRFYIQLSEAEYISAHRKFAENRPERLRLNIEIADKWIGIHVQSPLSITGNVMVHEPSGSWGVSFYPGAIPAIEDLPVFALTNVGRFDPDDYGVDIVQLPESLMAPNTAGPRVGKEIILQPIQATAPEAPAAKKQLTQEEYLARLRSAARILNNGIKKGYVPKFDEDGLIVKVSLPDLDIMPISTQPKD